MSRPLPLLCLLIATFLLSVSGSGGARAASAAALDPVGVWPLDPAPEVIARLDPPAGPYGAGHRGVDLLGTVGQPVRSALTGSVSFAGSIAGRGVVVVDHGSTRTTYEPVAAGLAVGTPVSAGATIGLLQVGPSHCAPRTCLHWGWIEGETYLDPLRLVGAGPVRLLPLAGLARPSLTSRGGVPGGVMGGVMAGWLPAWAGVASAAAAVPMVLAQARGCACR